jgi:hypothetical protein
MRCVDPTVLAFTSSSDRHSCTSFVNNYIVLYLVLTFSINNKQINSSLSLTKIWVTPNLQWSEVITERKSMREGEKRTTRTDETRSGTKNRERSRGMETLRWLPRIQTSDQHNPSGEANRKQEEVESDPTSSVVDYSGRSFSFSSSSSVVNFLVYYESIKRKLKIRCIWVSVWWKSCCSIQDE